MNRRRDTAADNPAPKTRLREQKHCASGATALLGKTVVSTSLYKENHDRGEAITMNRLTMKLNMKHVKTGWRAELLNPSERLKDTESLLDGLLNKIRYSRGKI